MVNGRQKTSETHRLTVSIALTNPWCWSWSFPFQLCQVANLIAVVHPGPLEVVDRPNATNDHGLRKSPCSGLWCCSFASLDSCIEFKTSKHQNMYQIYSNLLQSILWQQCNKFTAYLSYIVQASSLSSKVSVAWPWASLQLPVESWDIGQPWIRGTWDMKVPACHCRLRLQPLIAELQAMVSFAQRAAQWHLSHKNLKAEFPDDSVQLWDVELKSNFVEFTAKPKGDVDFCQVSGRKRINST